MGKFLFWFNVIMAVLNLIAFIGDIIVDSGIGHVVFNGAVFVLCAAGAFMLYPEVRSAR